MPEPSIPPPSQRLIKEYLHRWNQSKDFKKYRIHEASLVSLFELYPENKEIEHVLLKVSALNDFYSTNIFDTYSVAKHILEKDIDARLEKCDYSLVNDIAKIAKSEEKPRIFYSFASKYCSQHQPETYSIFDSFVEKMILHYQETDAFNGNDFSKSDLKKYESFIQIVKKFRSSYKLEKYSLKEIDIFLWIAGKEFFPREYKKNKDAPYSPGGRLIGAK